MRSQDYEHEGVLVGGIQYDGPPAPPRYKCAMCITILRMGKPEGGLCDCCERKFETFEKEYVHDGRRR